MQALIDVVDRFCQRWHMDINLKKSEVVVFGQHGCELCAQAYARAVTGCCPRSCTPWNCRGTTLKVVPKYKYLGIWFSHDLSWSTHIQAMLTKATEKTRSLRKLFNNNQVPARARYLV